MEPAYIPPSSEPTQNVFIQRERVDLTGRTWMNCTFDQCTIVLYSDTYAPTTVIHDCRFTNSTFVGDKRTIDILFDNVDVT